MKTIKKTKSGERINFDNIYPTTHDVVLKLMNADKDLKAKYLNFDEKSNFEDNTATIFINQAYENSDENMRINHF